MKDLKKIINTAWEHAMSYTRYKSLTEKYAADGVTTGPNQSESMINYTKLNFQRSKRVEKTTPIMEELKELSKETPATHWLLITESWCGDAASSVPIIGKLSEISTSIDLRIVLRDENPELIDRFLTNGGRSIPKLIGLTENHDVLFDWGPRPEGAQMLFLNWKNDPDSKPYNEFHIDIQKWYNQDKGISLQTELIEILKSTNHKDVAVV